MSSAKRSATYAAGKRLTGSNQSCSPVREFGRCRFQRQPHLTEHLRGNERLTLGIPDRQRTADDPHHRMGPRRGQPLCRCPLLGQCPNSALLRPAPAADPARVLALQAPPNREQRQLPRHHGGTDPRVVDRPPDLGRPQARGGGIARPCEIPTSPAVPARSRTPAAASCPGRRPRTRWRSPRVPRPRRDGTTGPCTRSSRVHRTYIAESGWILRQPTQPQHRPSHSRCTPQSRQRQRITARGEELAYRPLRGRHPQPEVTTMAPPVEWATGDSTAVPNRRRTPDAPAEQGALGHFVEPLTRRDRTSATKVAPAKVRCHVLKVHWHGTQVSRANEH
ncbi:hypothetical protein BZZ08_00636 [Streptomyces sp. MH60]|nr:hypothetical protein BZZ08_00636 [Streptomyces sp. MH60]